MAAVRTFLNQADLTDGRRVGEADGHPPRRAIGEEKDGTVSIAHRHARDPTRIAGSARENRLSGATFILGCYGGEDTFSDLVIARTIEHSDPAAFRRLNARLTELRNRIFERANAITSRRAW